MTIETTYTLEQAAQKLQRPNGDIVAAVPEVLFRTDTIMFSNEEIELLGTYFSKNDSAGRGSLRKKMATSGNMPPRKSVPRSGGVVVERRKSNGKELPKTPAEQAPAKVEVVKRVLGSIVTQPTLSIIDKKFIDDQTRQIAREQSHDLDEILGLLEETFAKVFNHNNDSSGDFRVMIDRKTYEVRAWRLWEVIPDDQTIEDVEAQKTLEEAKEIDSEAQIGGEISVYWPASVYDLYTNAQIFEQKYASYLRQKEKTNLLNDFLQRGNNLVNGSVKRIDRTSGDYVIDVQKMECRLRRSDAIPKESLRLGDRIRCLIREIKDDPNRGRMVYLTRTSEDFPKELFRREVPEINKGIIEIVGVSRYAGYGSKIAVRSNDERLDPVGICVGNRGSRAKSVTDNLSSEFASIIPWDQDEMNFVVCALGSDKIESAHVIGHQYCDVIVKEDNIAMVIGKSGMNVNLASRLTGWHINIINQQKANDREMQRSERKQSNFMKQLGIGESVARVLYNEGFNNTKELAETDEKELLEIGVFDESVVSDILQRAYEAVVRAESEFKEELTLTDERLREIVTDEEMLRALVMNEVLTAEDLAELSAKEFMEMVDDITEEEALEKIKHARLECGWFKYDDEN